MMFFRLDDQFFLLKFKFVNNVILEDEKRKCSDENAIIIISNVILVPTCMEKQK